MRSNKYLVALFISISVLASTRLLFKNTLDEQGIIAAPKFDKAKSNELLQEPLLWISVWQSQFVILSVHRVSMTKDLVSYEDLVVVTALYRVEWLNFTNSQFELVYDQGQKVSSVWLKEVGEHHRFKYDAVVIHFPAPQSVETTTNATLKIIVACNPDESNSFDICRASIPKIKVPASKTLHNSPKTVVCMSPIFGSPSSLLIEWFEYHSMLGVDHFIAYLSASQLDLMSLRILERYQEVGMATLLDWENQLELPMHSRGQLGAAHDCLYRANAAGVDLAFFIDIDEFLQVFFAENQQTDLFSKKDVWPATSITPKNRTEPVGIYYLQSWLWSSRALDARPSSSKRELHTSKYVYRASQPQPAGDERTSRRKYAVRPSMVSSLRIFHAYPFDRRSICAITISSKDLRLNHYINAMRLPMSKINETMLSTLDTSMQQFSSELERRIAAQLKQVLIMA